MHVYDVLKRPVVTEKTTAQGDAATSTAFEVDRRANKMQVKDAVETAFNVTVVAVHIVNIPANAGIGRTMVVRSRRGRRRRDAGRKAIRLRVVRERLTPGQVTSSDRRLIGNSCPGQGRVD